MRPCTKHTDRLKQRELERASEMKKCAMATKIGYGITAKSWVIFRSVYGRIITNGSHRGRPKSTPSTMDTVRSEIGITTTAT